MGLTTRVPPGPASGGANVVRLSMSHSAGGGVYVFAMQCPDCQRQIGSKVRMTEDEAGLWRNDDGTVNLRLAQASIHCISTAHTVVEHGGDHDTDYDDYDVMAFTAVQRALLPRFTRYLLDAVRPTNPTCAADIANHPLYQKIDFSAIFVSFAKDLVADLVGGEFTATELRLLGAMHFFAFFAQPEGRRKCLFAVMKKMMHVAREDVARFCGSNKTVNMMVPRDHVSLADADVSFDPLPAMTESQVQAILDADESQPPHSDDSTRFVVYV